MTRDHYRGVPKSVKVIKSAAGKVQDLNKIKNHKGAYYE
jgi:hypothetical protein